MVLGKLKLTIKILLALLLIYYIHTQYHIIVEFLSNNDKHFSISPPSKNKNGYLKDLQIVAHSIRSLLLITIILKTTIRIAHI